MEQEDITFSQSKTFKFIKTLGSGGTGDTSLYLDETTRIYFAIKSYQPKDQSRIDEDFGRFIDEIKILLNISHPNIVRIYTYYLYPRDKKGYLQMEFIQGTSIKEFFDKNRNMDDMEVVFIDAISAFAYLEQLKILHRDIRPANILIDENKCLKIIDFGFGKRLESKESSGKSIVLNWPVAQLPSELTDGQIEYTNKSEIYFLGNLFRNILGDEVVKFRYNSILEKMSEVSRN